MAAIDLKTPFDDDSHTLEDGALKRFFRMRKWMFGTGLALLLLDTGWLDFEGVVKALGAPGVPKPLVHFAVTLTAIYLLIQAALVLWQVSHTYADDAEVSINAVGSRSLRYWTKKLVRASAIRREHQERGLPATPEKPDLALLGYEDLENSMQAKADAAYRRSLANRTRVRLAEYLIDAMRVVPSVLFLLYAVVAHGALSFAA